MTETQQTILDSAAALKARLAQAKEEVASLCRFAYEDVPRIIAEETRALIAERDAAIQKAKMLETFNEKWEQDYSVLMANRDAAIQRAEQAESEIERLRQELGCIANAKRHSFFDTGEFVEWVQSRARHALGQKTGTLTIKK